MMVNQLSAEQQQVMHVHGYDQQLLLKGQGLIDRANKGELAPITALEDMWQMLVDAEAAKLEQISSGLPPRQSWQDGAQWLQCSQEH